MPLYPGDTTTIKAIIMDKNGVKIDATSHAIKVYDADGNLKGTYTDPIRDDVGEHHLNYTIPSDGKSGTWKVIWKAVTAEGTKTESISFDVLKA
jgi:uncharacterized protein YfaS (alpha-2-macroglobulin family)